MQRSYTPTVDNPEAFDTERDLLLAKRAELRKRLATEFTPADLRFEPVGHLARVTFALTEGNVETYPTDTAPKRLMDWAVTHNFY